MNMPKFNITQLIQNRAINICNEKKTFIEEWKVVIITTLILKVFTILISTFCGYFDIYLYLYPVIKNEIVAIVGGVISILILEFFTALFLSKVVKFLLHWEKVQFLIALSGAIFLFYVSFNVSTSGLAKRQGMEYDNKKTIQSDFETEKNNAKVETEKSILGIQKLISTIEKNPQGWQNHKREILLSEQLATIENYNEKILQLKDNLNNTIESINKKQSIELSINDKNINKVENKYYFFVTVIICINFICNFLIMFFYTKIKDESIKDEKITNELQNISLSVDKTIQDMFISRFNIHLNNFNSQVVFSNNNEKRTVKKPEKTVLNESENNGNEKKTVLNESNTDFSEVKTVLNESETVLNKEPETELTYAKEVEIPIYVTRNAVNEPKYDNYYTCEYCGKKYKYARKKQRFCQPECKTKWHQKKNKEKKE